MGNALLTAYGTDKTKQIMLRHLREQGTISAAARAMGISRQTYWEYRKQDPEFDAAVVEALEAGIAHVADQLESVLFARAIDDDRRDTTALIFALKGTRPERYQQSVRIEQVNSEVEKIAAKFGISAEELLTEVGRLAGGHAREVASPNSEAE